MPVSTSQLRVVMRDRAFCRVHRARFKEREDGYIVGVGPKWLLMAVVGGGYRMDGFRALRVGDISRLQSPVPYPGFIPVAHRLMRISPPKAPPIKLNSLAALLDSIPAMYRAVAIHTEMPRPHVCFIGSVQRVSPRQVWLREINPNADWGETETPYKLADITRVDIGDEYTLALVEVNAAKATDAGRRRPPTRTRLQPSKRVPEPQR